MKWYPTDWRADPALRMCSLAARGLWIEMLGYMHEAQPYGHLLIGDRAPTAAQLAVLVGSTPKAVGTCLAELAAANVFSVIDGVMLSRRMVRDKAKAEQDAENGKGGGNPKLIEPVNKGVNKGVNPPLKAQKSEVRSQKSEPEESRAEPPARKRAAQLAAGWTLPDDWMAWALQERPGWNDTDALRVSLLFRDHWHSKGEARADWEATWRNWVRREKAVHGTPKLSPAGTQSAQALGAWINDGEVRDGTN